MNNDSNRPSEPRPAADEPSTEANTPEPADERAVSTTVGTGSYIAISCTVMALLVTFVILGILLLSRWF